MAITPETTAGTEISTETQLEFLNIFDNIRLNAQKTFTQTDAYDPEIVAYQRALLIEFTNNPMYRAYMTPIAQRLNRPDLLENLPEPAATESFMEGIETPYALEDAKSNAADIYAVLESGDVDLLFGLGYDPISRTLPAEQVDSFIASVVGQSDAVISEEIDVATTVLAAHPNTLDIAGQYTSVHNMRDDEAAAFVEHTNLLQLQAQAELASIETPVIPASAQSEAIQILADMNDAAAESILTDTPPVIVDVAAELATINAANEPVAVDVTAAEEHFDNALESQGLPVPAEADPLPEVDTAVTLAAENTDPTAAASVTNFSDASILLNGEASDDMAYLATLAEEARAMGVDTTLIDSIEAQITVSGDQTKFVTTAAATEAVIFYADALDLALKDGTVGRDEYQQALSGLFTSLSAGGIVTDRVGISDDIAAAPGMKDEAQDSLRRVFDASVVPVETRVETPTAAAVVTQRGWTHG